MTISLAIKINQIVVKEDKLYRYAMEMPNDRMLFVPLHDGDGHEFVRSETEIEKLFGARKIKFHTIVRDAEGNIIGEDDPFDIGPMQEESKKVKNARSLFFYLQKWHANPTSLYHPTLHDFVTNHAKEARANKHDWEPSAGVMHRAIKQFPDITSLTARFLVSKSGQVQRERWHPEVGALLERIIHFYWERDTRGRNYTDANAEFDGWFTALAETFSKDPAFIGPLKKPSDETLRAYIDSAACFETWAKKYSEQEADARFRGNRHPIAAKKLLEVVMINSTVLDEWCVLDDETLLPLGRPTLTIAIDLCTRMILAAVITYEPPSLFTAMACLKRINMPKHDINARFPSIQRVSDGWGKPTTVVVDNELAQVGKSYQAAAEDARIRVKWAPVKRPQFKAVVERFFRTLNDILIKKLPGGLPYKPDVMRQLGIDPSEVATITLSMLTELINMAINDVYHYDPHSTIGKPPALAWEQSKRKNKRQYIGEVDFLDKAFGALDDGHLTTSGVRFDNMTFHDPSITSLLLDDLASSEPKRRRRKSRLSSASVHVMFKYNPANIEAIHVWNAKIKKYVTLPNIAGEAAKGLSKWHWRILRIWAHQESIAFSSPAEQLAARRRLREAIEERIPHEAYKAIKTMRRIIHEPSQIVEGDVVLMTRATPTVGGMDNDDIEVEVQLYAPEGPRIPPKGPDRSGRRGRGRRTKPEANANSRSPAQPSPKSQPDIDDLVKAFSEEVAPAPAPPPPRRNTEGFDATFDSIIRQHRAKTNVGDRP